MAPVTTFNPAAVAPYQGTTFQAPAGLIETEIPSITPNNALDRFFGKDRMAVADSFVEAARSGEPKAQIVFATRRNGKTALINYLTAIAKRDLPEALLLRLDGSRGAAAESVDELYRLLVKFRDDINFPELTLGVLS